MSLTTLEERLMPLFGDMVFDFVIIMICTIVISSLFPSLHAVIFFTLIIFVAFKYHLIMKSGRHPAYSMFNKSIISSRKNVLTFLWPSIISISILSIMISFVEPFAPAAKNDRFIVFDCIEWIVSTNALQYFVLFRFAILIAMKFGFIKSAIQTKEM